jgi:hypothetical protein
MDGPTLRVKMIDYHIFPIEIMIIFYFKRRPPFQM